MSHRALRYLATCLLLSASLQLHAASSAGPAVFSPPDPNAIPQNVAMPATLCDPVTGMAGPYPCKKVDLLYFMPLASLDCGSAAVVWGWTDPSTQKEYALLACNTGISFVDITIPTAPLYLGRLPGHSANSLWRDVKVYQHYAFVGSEASGHGLQVFDLYRLRNVQNPPAVFTEDAWYGNFTRSHTIWINQSTGFLYAAGSAEGPQTCGGDLHVVDIRTPTAPSFAGCLALNGYVHESQCVTYTGPDTAYQGHEICFTSNGRFDNTDTIGIDDVTNKSSIQQLARFAYDLPGYAHQSFLTEDQQYMLFDDEFDEQDNGFNSRTLIFDVRDLNAPVFKGYFYGTTTAVDHNQYVRGGYVFQSNYRAGLRIVDLKNIASVPNTNLTEYGYFDIYPSDDAAQYNGSWGNYPYFPSGNVAVAGIEQGLFILKPNFLPKVSVNDIQVVEGTAGQPRNVTFTITLTAPSAQTVIVNYSTAPGTAIGGTKNSIGQIVPPDADYLTTSGAVIISPGITTITKQIGVITDNVDEDDETFYLNLTTATNAEIDDAQGMATIVDDDAPVPTIMVSDVALNEGDAGDKTAEINLTLTPVVPGATVQWSTANSTATAGEDYETASGTATFDANGGAKIFVIVHGDMTIEPNEAFFVNLSNPSGAILGDSQAIVTITNDDLLSVQTVSPTSGPSTGGTSVTIGGTRFADGVAIHFGEAEATDIVVIDQATLTAKTPVMPPAALLPIDAHFGANTPNPVPLHHPAALLFFSDFLDVPGSHAFHYFIEKIFRNGITSGCGGGNYCPSDPVSRAQMAIFLLTSKYGPAYTPPPAIGRFADVPISDPFAPWIERLYVEGITGGCGTNPLRYCPAAPVTRDQMAVFLLVTREGTSYTPPACSGVFGDVACPSGFANWIEALYQRGITGGCSSNPLLYCPAGITSRGQMAVFLSTTFGLQ